jgi:hypothetical protein
VFVFLFRLRREKSAEEDMKLEVMKKEEALLLELDLMKEDKLKKDEENDKLRQQLNEMKAKMEKVQGLSMRTLDVWSFFTA